MSVPATFGIVGSGWRADFFARLAALLPERLTLVGAAVRRAGSVEEVAHRWKVPVHLSPAELISKQHPDFVVVSVPWPATPVLPRTQITAAIVDDGVPVLAETPPAPDADGLRALWARAVVWRNPFTGLRLMDEEIAIATLLTATADWARDAGPPPYPLAEACQDHLLSLAIDEAAAAADGQTIATEIEPWRAR